MTLSNQSVFQLEIMNFLNQECVSIGDSENYGFYLMKVSLPTDEDDARGSLMWDGEKKKIFLILVLHNWLVKIFLSTKSLLHTFNKNVYTHYLL